MVGRMARVEVHVDQDPTTLHAGTAFFTRGRGRPSTTFSYTPEFLGNKLAYSLDPALPLVVGAQHVAGPPGAFSDSAPDRWGRQLVEKQEIAKAREDGRRAEALDDVDYLLAVSDSTRHGAIRFAAGGGTFANSGTDVPKLIRLPELLRASDDVAANDELSAIKRLLDAGTGSLGGARPKASIRFDDGRLGIAKFPHSDDNGESPWGRPGERGGRSDLREPEHFDTHCFAGLADDDLPRDRGGRTSLRESGEITRGAIRRLCRILSQRDFARANATYKDAGDPAPPCRTGCRDQHSAGPHRGA